MTIDNEQKFVADLVKESKLFKYPDIDRKPSWKVEEGKDGKKKIIKTSEMDPYIVKSVERCGAKFTAGENVLLSVGQDDCVPVKIVCHKDGKYVIETEAGMKRTVEEKQLLRNAENYGG